MTAGPQPVAAGPNRSPERWLFFGGAVLAACLYFGTAMGPLTPWFSRQPLGYYGLQTAGLRAGHTYAAIAPHPGLLALKDPYDPVANAPYQVHDMSFYRGHYYLYFGITPVLIAFWPCAALTGWYPTEPLVVAAFCTAAAILGLALLWGVRCRYFPAASRWSVACAVACLIFANPMNRLVESPQFYQVAIAGAVLMQMAMLAALYRCLHAERHAVGWLALASLWFGLSVGARPNYMPSAVALLIALAVLARRAGRPLPLRRWGTLLAAAAGPATVCGAGLMLYNRLRFDSVFEFGMRYALAGKSQLDFIFFDPVFLPPHLLHFLFVRGFWSDYFPFFSGEAGQPYGFLRYDVWGWLALYAFGLAALRPRVGPGAVFSLIIGAAGLGNLLLLATFLGTNERYCCDFASSWILLGGIGGLALSQRAGSPGSRARVNGLLGLLAAVSIFTCMAVYVGHAPAQIPLLTLGRAANGPRYFWRRSQHEREGALKVELVLAPTRGGLADPIFETGLNPGERDWLQIDPLPGDQARVSFHHTGMAPLTGEAFAIPPHRRLVVEACCGSLLPPFDDPTFSNWTLDEFSQVKRDLKVSVDGIPRLHAVLDCYPASPGDLRVGRLAWFADGVAQVFSGRVIRVERLALVPPASHLAGLTRAAPIEIDFRLPAQHEAGGDPLIATGRGQSSDLLYCSYDGRGQIRFALDHYGTGGPASSWVGYDAVKLHHLTVWMGSLDEAGATGGIKGAPEGPQVIPPNHRLYVRFDGQTLLNVEQVFYPGTPGTARIGENPYRSTAAGRRFEGLVERIGQSDLAALPPLAVTGRYGGVELLLRLPGNAWGAHEPLVVSGVSGLGDLLYINYLDARHVAIGLDHWGYAGLSGRPIEVDYGQPHRVSVTMGSLYPPETVGDQATRVRVTIDGRIALDGNLQCHPSNPSQIHVGTNPIGGSTCGPAFTGQLLSVERVASNHP